jgi:hypothetical protein
VKITLWPAYTSSCDDFFQRPRSELSGPLKDGESINLLKDNVYKITFDIMIPDTWNDISANTIVSQNHYGSYRHEGNSYDVGPGGKLRVDDGRFKIEFATKRMNCSSSGCSKETIQRETWNGPEIVKGKWYSILIHYSLKTPGFYRGYIDGQLIGEFQGETWNRYQDSTGHRIGVYASRWQTSDRSISNSALFDNYKIVLE